MATFDLICEVIAKTTLISMLVFGAAAMAVMLLKVLFGGNHY